ncbi:MAG: M48 family metalloprotease [Neisseriaceae bacterium]|nr:M48 family metalloprotease [Neisseriaceae bacterium]
MAINFYRQQEESIRKAWFLLALFLVATFLLTVAITTLSALAIKLFLLVFLPNANFPNSLLWLIGFLCPVLVFSASVKKLKQLSKGNYSAIMAGGVLLKTTDNLQEQRLRNTVEEIAISANIPVPHIYILKMEPSVNAFAAGLRPTDMAIGITRGAFEILNRDELQGVIAYEMAQIINGHARLNTLVYGVLFGLDFIYIHLKKFFSIIFKPFSKEINRVHKKELDQHEATSFIVSFYSIVLGIFLFLPLSLMVVVSYIGHFFAQIIKSSICRQNVFQADATAVQLARNPNGIASVLQKSLQTKWSYILFADTFMQELSHLLFTFGSNPIY